MNKFTDQIKKLVSSKDTTPEKITKKLIDSFRKMSMENNSIDSSSMVLITEKSEILECSIPFDVAKSSFGGVMMKSLVSALNKSETTAPVNSVVDMCFATGVVKRSKNIKDIDKVKEDLDKLHSEGKDIRDYNESEQYMIVNVQRKDKLEMLVYGVIQTDTKDALAISSKPIFKEILDYDEKQFINYFINN